MSLKFLCKMCGGDADTHQTKYCWPSDSVLISQTSESQKNLKERGYNAELAHFRIEYGRLREQIVALLKQLDDVVAPAAYAAYRAKGAGE